MSTNSNGSRESGGFTYTNIKIPVRLHKAMLALLEARNKGGYGDLKLYSLFDEAVEQYLEAKPQRDLLKGYGDGTSKKGRAAGG